METALSTLVEGWGNLKNPGRLCVAGKMPTAGLVASKELVCSRACSLWTSKPSGHSDVEKKCLRQDRWPKIVWILLIYIFQVVNIFRGLPSSPNPLTDTTSKQPHTIYIYIYIYIYMNLRMDPTQCFFGKDCCGNQCCASSSGAWEEWVTMWEESRKNPIGN